MTNAEIVKALEYKIKVLCDYCDIKDKECCSTCVFGLAEASLDLIHRLQEQNAALIAGQETLQKHIAEKDAEIERLEETVDHLIEMVDA